ncbi:MAG: RelA/SpoT domain-containing protein [Burkholderiaceae bacterium]|jgi:ppGpp synthetase/RelA/SpoT-type nucleotidyltranferase|nr:RelA/SpoT domain-containing protein [Burkholderiaceae bacterium]
MTDDELLTEYKARHTAMLAPLAGRLQAHIQELLAKTQRIDRVSARAKSPERFIGKAKRLTAEGARKYEHPFEQIQDLVGARVIVFYKQDVEAVREVLNRYFRRIESRNLVPDSVNQFGYVGRHLILAIPEDVVDDDADHAKTPQFFELQVKTLFQHAWSEAEHDLAYKASEPPSAHQRRQIAFTAAQAWGADEIFEQLHTELGPRAS